jgi:HEAT repeat protein
MQLPAEIPFQNVLDALLDVETPLNPRFLYRLSDLESPELDQLQATWSKIPAWRRQALLEDIEELNENDMLLSFESLGRFALQDEDPKVRLLAVHILWEFEETNLIPVFLRMMTDDSDNEVRAACATALGRFVYVGELEEIPERTLHTIEDALIAAVNGSDTPEVRRSALESLGYSSRDEVTPLVEKAFASDDKVWKASALFAMGRSANQKWGPTVLTMLNSNLPLLRSEAARAAGELELAEAVPYLFELLDDPDDNTRQASIWSLSQIGGEGVRDTLQALYDEADSDQELELLESALDNLTFNEGLQLIPMFDFPEPEDDEEDWYEEYDLEDMGEIFDEEEEDEE